MYITGGASDKPHFETQEGDTEYITESGKVRNGHDILNFKAAHTLAYAHPCIHAVMGRNPQLTLHIAIEMLSWF